MTYVAEDFVFPEPSEDTVDFIRATYTGDVIIDQHILGKLEAGAKVVENFCITPLTFGV